MPIKIELTVIVGDVPNWAREQMSEVFNTDNLMSVLSWLLATTDDDWVRDWSIEESDTEETEVLRES